MISATVSFDDSGMRCDRYVALHFSQYSRAQVRRWMESGAITVNGAMVKTSAKLRAGDRIEIQPPPVTSSVLVPEDIPLDILYEDSDLIVINKSADMVVHPGAGRATRTLVHALLAHCKDLEGVGNEERPGIVHRLDKGTSGVIVVAKSDLVHHALQAQFRSREVTKEYLACVHGVPRGRAGVWDCPIGRHPIQRKKMSVSARGRAALTRWEVVESFGAFASLMHLFLHTGRTHQIRVHAAEAGHPLVGDLIYGGSSVRRGPEVWRMVAQEFVRPALHALRLQLTHPGSGEFMEWTAPVPEDMAELVLAARRIAEDAP